METLFIYLLKSSGLIAMFYLSYHFLVRKETFFNSNRWFLVTGLFTSLLLPLFSIKKIVYVERPKISMDDLIAYSKASSSATVKDIPAVEAFDWIQFIWVGYILIASILVIKIVLNILSLYRMLYKQQVIKKERFTLVDINENIAPFSFFKYIVYNSNLYSNEELQSILLHEKIHSQERHSMDVLIAKLFCIAFWFNPFVWLYKKAITQNLEYIADQKAIVQLEDKKAYQKALLKVVSNQSCLSITNNFYQSLIKKRIVMLNTNQSHKKNSWKYALVIPALIGFVLLFQVKTIAQERKTIKTTSSNSAGIYITTNKNSTDLEMKNDAQVAKDKYGITIKFSKVKRNSNGEITGIKVTYKDKDGNTGTTQFNGKEPIKPIYFYKTGTKIGFGKSNIINVFNDESHGEGHGDGHGESYAYSYGDSIPEMNFDIDIEVPEAPEAPEAAESPEVAEAPSFPKHFWNDSDTETKIIVKKDGAKPLVILNGKVIEGDESVISKKELDELIDSSSKGAEGDKKHVYINWNDAVKLRNDVMANAKNEMKKMRPIIKKEMERAKSETERARPEMERAREAMGRSRPDMEQAKAEMMQAKEEMQKAKAEMEQAKAELEKARAELKNKK